MATTKPPGTGSPASTMVARWAPLPPVNAALVASGSDKAITALSLMFVTVGPRWAPAEGRKTSWCSAFGLRRLTC